jgi:hypothetical protein
MRRIHDCDRFRGHMVVSLSLGLALALNPGTPSLARAAQVASQIKLDADDLSKPIVLDQYGHTLHLPTRSHTGPLVLADGAVPSYIAYLVDRDDTLPKGFPTVVTGPGEAARTTGPLHLDAQVKAHIDSSLAQNGSVAVSNGTGIFLVKPIPSVFGNNVTGESSDAPSLAWLASQAFARRSATEPSGASSSSPPSVPTSVPQAQSLIPSSITKPITKSKLLRDLQHLAALKSGKLVNWNQQTLSALESDLRIGPPKNVAPHLSIAKPTLGAQLLDLAGNGTAGSPRPAPVPEPRSIIVFALATVALAVRGRFFGRRDLGRSWGANLA